MKALKLLYIAWLFLLAGCDTSRTNESELAEIDQEFQTALMKSNEEAKNYKVYFLIPNSGCSGCISSAENMLKNNIEKYPKVRYVLTNIESVKTLSYKMGFDVTKHKLIKIDNQNFFYSGKLRSIYPQIFLMSKEDGHVVKRLEVSPDEDGLQILKDWLAKN